MSPPHDTVAPHCDLAYWDCQHIPLPQPMTAIEAWNRMMARPLPGMALAFRIRDAIAARFGVKRIGGFSGRRATPPQVGDKLDFFRVERADPHHLTLTERDRHLDVMISVLTEGQTLSIAATVKTHNAFGTAYMLPVAPAHRLIVATMLRRLQKDLSAAQ